MKKILVKLIAAITCVTMLTACQPTPEDEAIMSKKDKQFEKLILEAASDVKTEYPESYKNDFVSKDKKVNFTIDAEVTVSDENKYPVFTIKLMPITDEMTQRLVEVFLEGDDGYYPLSTLTKSELAEEIIKIQARLADEEGLREFCGDDETYDRVVANHQGTIEFYQGKMKDAPEEKLKIPTELVFQPLDFYLEERIYSQYSAEQELKEGVKTDESENKYLISDTVLSDGRFGRMRVSNEFNNIFIDNSAYGDERYQMFMYKIHSYVGLSNLYMDDPFNASSGDGDIMALFPKLTITKDEALDIAKNALNDMGVDYFYLMSSRVEKEMPTYKEWTQIYQHQDELGYDFGKAQEEVMSKKPEIFYIFEFRPTYFDVPFIPANSRYMPEETYRPTIENEKIRIRVSNDGVAAFSWINPIEAINVINDDVKLLPFEEIIKYAQQRMKLSYNLVAMVPLHDDSDIDLQLEKYKEVNVNIYEIELGLTRIPVYNKVGEYMMIPVWNFYGVYDIIGKSEENTHLMSDDDLSERRYKIPLVTVNAIDGSIIKEVMQNP